MSVDLIGYSERGMMNAISEDLAHSSDPALVGDFMSQFSFPTSPPPDWTEIKQVKILVEQSFSDFGDADMLILIEHKNQSRTAIFVEANRLMNQTDEQRRDASMAECLRFVCSGCGTSIEAWSDDNPFYIDDRFTPTSSSPL